MDSLEALRQDSKARSYIELADRYLEGIGYTEHGLRHCANVSEAAGRILRELGHPARDSELASIAGYLHDIGNMAGRVQHHRIGAMLAKELMEAHGFPLPEIGRVMAAIVIHEEDEGVERHDPISAALLIADKSDVHRSRVRASGTISLDIHDRVNYAATHSEIQVDSKERTISLWCVIDTRISPVIEYFEIFLTRMTACRKAARSLDCEFHLVINGSRMA